MVSQGVLVQQGGDQQGVMFGQGGMEQKQQSRQMVSLGLLVQQGEMGLLVRQGMEQKQQSPLVISQGLLVQQGGDQQGLMFGQGEMELNTGISNKR